MKITKLPNGGELEECNNEGSKYWYINGKLHREDGPAIESAYDYKEWYLNGKRHREDGPAVEHAYGYKEWWLNHKQISQNEYERLMRLKAFW
jgi:hypothetical protein